MASEVGKMRERVSVYSQTQIVNPAGEMTTAWGVANPMQWSPDALLWDTNALSWGGDPDFQTWARVEPMGATGIVLANRDDAQRLYRMTIRYRTDITTNSQVIWRGRKFDVEGVLDHTEQRQFLSATLREINA